MVWVMLQNVDKKRIMVNLDLSFCISEMPDGGAQVVSIAGAGVPLADTFDEVSQQFNTEPQG